MSDLYRLGDEFAMEPDDWLDQLVKSGALVPVTLREAVAWVNIAFAELREDPDLREGSTPKPSHSGGRLYGSDNDGAGNAIHKEYQGGVDDE